MTSLVLNVNCWPSSFSSCMHYDTQKTLFARDFPENVLQSGVQGGSFRFVRLVRASFRLAEVTCQAIKLLALVPRHRDGTRTTLCRLRSRSVQFPPAPLGGGSQRQRNGGISTWRLASEDCVLKASGSQQE